MTRPGRRTLLPAGALAAAIAVAGVTGWYPYAALTPDAPSVTLRPGQQAELAGARYSLEEFVVDRSLPADDPKDPPVTGPAGSTLVLVVVGQTVLDPSVDLETRVCTATLTDGTGGTVWQTDSDVTSLVARPAAYGCDDSDSAPLRYGEARRTGFSFVVPTSAAGHLSARLAIKGGPTLALEP